MATNSRPPRRPPILRTASVDGGCVSMATRWNHHENTARRTSEHLEIGRNHRTWRRRLSQVSTSENGAWRKVHQRLLRTGYRVDENRETTESEDHENRKKELLTKFRFVAKLVVLMSRLAKSHTLRNNIYDVIAPHIKGLHFRDYVTKADTEELLFDPNKFKADKRLRVGEETKRILCKQPLLRTASELHYVEIALRNIPVYAEYPVRMQRSLVRVAMFEQYQSKRVIVRQGHNALNFYIILSGSVVVMVCDEETKVPKPTAYLHRGKAFGELAIIHRTSRQSTVIAKEPVELLTIDVEDFHRIFMSGGVKNINDPDHNQFIRNISFLKGWPLIKMVEHPEECIFHYFKRGDVLVKDSKFSDWIYIVKSGSLRVLKKLRRVRPFQWRKKGYQKLPKMSQSQHFNKTLTESHRKSVLSDINIPLRSAEEVSLSEIDTARSNQQHHVSNQGDTSYTKPHIKGFFLSEQQEPTEVATATTPLQRPKRLEFTATKRCLSTNIPKPLTDEAEFEEEMEGRQQQIRTIIDDINSAYRQKSPEITEADLDPEFVDIQTLTKGQDFGLSDILFCDQPSLCVVSNGAECIMLHKNLYLRYASEKLLLRLGLERSPYPSDVMLQRQLQIHVDWQVYRQMTVKQLINNIKLKRLTQCQM